MSELSKKLALLSAASPESDGLDNPFVEDEKSDDSDIHKALPKGRDIFALSPKAQKKKVSRLEDLIQRTNYLNSYAEDLFADELDGFLDELNEDDEELRDTLVSMGRKYNRDNASTPGSAEVTKMYSQTEKTLKQLIGGLNDDMQALQKDIDQMRLSRSRNFKAFSDLISAKKGFYDSQLSIIKEMNRTKEKQYEYRQKEAAKKAEQDQGSNNLSSNTIRDLFGLGRGDIVSSVGGYESISGATTEDTEGNTVYESYDDDRPLEDSYTDEDSDGERFLKYEGMGVEYVLLVNSDGTTENVIAEDRDGNYIPDYPLPTDFMNLSFEIDKKSGRATDDYHRSYKVRYV